MSVKIFEIFKFEKRDVEFYMIHKLKLKDKFINSFSYLISKLKVQAVVDDLSTLEWSEGKNYDWVALQDEKVFLLIRHYQTHFTIYYKSRYKDSSYGEEYDDHYNTHYGCFTFYTDTDKVENSDNYCDNRFLDLNIHIKDLIDLIRKHKVHLLWNNLVFVRPDYVEVKNIWDGDENISSLDLFSFACEEMFHKYTTFFAENEMFQKVKTLKVGDIVGHYTVLKVHDQLENDYYHGVGLTLGDTNGKDSERFQDVYSLTMYYYNDVFGEQDKE